MAEVTRVLREVQLDTEGVPVRGSAPLNSRRRSKFVKDGSAAVGATKADRKLAVAGGNKDVGTFIGVANAKLASKVKAASWSDFAATKADADAGNKEAVGSITCEIGVAKAEEVVGTSKPLAEIENPKEERKAEPAVTKERVPESQMARIKARPMRKIPPLSDRDRPLAISLRTRERLESTIALVNGLVDLEQDCLRQHKEKGYAEIGVDFTDGIKNVFILPN